MCLCILAGCAAVPRQTISPPLGYAAPIEIVVTDIHALTDPWLAGHVVFHMQLSKSKDTPFRDVDDHAVSQDDLARILKARAAKSAEPMVVSFYLSNSRDTTVQYWAQSVFWLRTAIQKANVKNRVIILAYIAGPETGKFKPPF